MNEPQRLDMVKVLRMEQGGHVWEGQGGSPEKEDLCQ